MKIAGKRKADAQVTIGDPVEREVQRELRPQEGQHPYDKSERQDCLCTSTHEGDSSWK